MKYIFSILLCFTLNQSLTAQLSFQIPKDNPIELGKVNWTRNYDKATQLSEQEQKPILILFQEVPGCSTCQNFGSDVLSHPFLVEMIETYFIPLAIFNNVNGHDREILNQFNEPTWNNPVIRIVDKKGEDLVPRLGRQWTELGLASTIKEALDKRQIKLPEYFKIYLDELIGRSGPIKEANLAMFCFWTGEKELAQIDGILSTEPGFMNGHEVVKIEYNPYVTSLDKIVPIAAKKDCADEVYVDDKVQLPVPVKASSRYRKDKDNKYYLSNSEYKFIPMTPLQAAKVNAEIGKRNSPDSLLSPRQLEILKHRKVFNRISNIGKDLRDEWYTLIN